MKQNLLFILFIPQFLSAQSGFLLPQTANSRRIDLAVTPAGDRIVIGEVYYRGLPSIDLDPGPEELRFPSLGDDAGFGTFVASYSAAGELNFAFPISDADQAYNNVQAHFVETDAVGNIYLKGQYYGQADFDPSEAVYRLTAAAANEDRTFIASYTPRGALRFAIDLPHHPATKLERVDFRQFGVDAAGNSYAFLVANEPADYDPGAGEFTPETGRGVVVSYDNAGNFRFGFSTLRSPFVLGVAPNGAFSIVGSFRPEDEGLDLDPGEQSFVPGYTADSIKNILLAYGADRELRFVQGFAGTSLSPYFVDGDQDGNVYLGADYFPGTTDVAPGADDYLITHNGEQGMEPDLLLVKYAPDGRVVRGFTLEDRGEDPSYDLLFDHALTDDGRLFLSGFIEGGAVDFDPSPTQESLVEGGADQLDRSFVAAYDADLNLEFAYSIEGTDATTDEPAGPLLQIAAASACSDFALLGNVHLPLTADYDPGEGTLTPAPAVPTEDSIALLLLNQYVPGATPAGEASCDPLSSTRRAARRSMAALSATPNPSVDGNFLVRLPAEQSAGGRYRVVDLSGRVVLRGYVRDVETAVPVPVDLSGKAPGVYVFHLASSSGASSVRLIKGN